VERCCRAYIAHMRDCQERWRGPIPEWLLTRHPLMRQDYDDAIAWGERIVTGIEAGDRCPWHARDNDPSLKSYRYLMSLPDDELKWAVDHLGPIQVIPAGNGG
jgi:hypothetical protein